MNKLNSSFLFLLLLLSSSCFIDLDDDELSLNCRRADGPNVSVELPVDGFDGIDLTIAANVFLRQGSTFEVLAEGPEEAVTDLEDRVFDGIWRIDTRRCYRNSEEINIFITLPELREIRNSGSGDLLTEEFFLVDDLDLHGSGSGDMNLLVEADRVDARINGSGDIRIEGLANQLELSVRGSGDWRGFGFESLEADVVMSGSGDAEVRVVDFLLVRISGSGDVLFKGNPDLEVNDNGSGDVRDAN